MNFLDIIKFRLGMKIKAIDKPIEKMEIEEKEKMIISYMQDIEIQGRVPDKIYEIIDSIDVDIRDKEDIVYRMISIMARNEFKISDELRNELGQNLVEKYFSNESKFRILSKSIGFLEFHLNRASLFRSFKDYLTNFEIRAILNAPVTIDVNIDDTAEILKEAMYSGLELSEDEISTIIMKDKKAIYDFLNSLSFKEKMKFAKKINKRFDFQDFISNLPDDEKIFLEIDRNGYDFDESSKIEIEKLIEILQDYEEISEYGLREYISSKYSFKELAELVELTKNANFSKAAKEKFLNFFNDAKEASEMYEILEKYDELENEEEKTKYFNTLDSKVVSKYIFHFREEFEKLTKEEMLLRFQDCDNIVYILRIKFTDRELYELLKNGKISNLDLSEEMILNFSVDEIEEILNLNSKDDLRYKMRELLHIIQYGGLRSGFDEDDKNKIADSKIKELQIVAIKALLNGNDSDKSRISSLIKNYEDCKNVITYLPEAIGYFDYDKFNTKDLIGLNEFLGDNLNYNLNLLKRLKNGNSNNSNIEDDEGKALTKLRVEKIISILNNNIDIIKENTREWDINSIFRNLSIEQIENIFDSLESPEIKKYFISRTNVYSVLLKQPEKLANFLQNIDENGDFYIKAYESMKSEDGEPLWNSICGFMGHIDFISNNKEKLLNLLEKNPNLFSTINYGFLELFEDSTDVEFYTRYESLKKIYVGEGKELYKKIINRLKENLKNPEELIQKCLDNMRLEHDIVHKIEDTEDIDKIIFMLTKRPYLVNHGFESYELIRDYEEDEEKYFKKVLENPDCTLENMLDIYTRRFFNMKYSEAKEFVSKYEDGIKDLLKRYEEKEDLTIDEQLEVSSMNRLIYLKEILNIKDVDALRSCYENLSNNPDLSERDYLENLICEENIKRAYTKEKKENLYSPQNSDKIKNIEYEGEKIEVYKPQGNWNMLITVVGAYVKNDAAKENPKEEWNTNEKLNNHGICTSLIGNNNLSMAFKKGVPILGFFNIGDNSIYEEAEYDLGSNSNDIEIKTRVPSRFRLTKRLINHIRLGHGESVLERRSESPTNDTVKRQPDFVVAINEIDEVAKKAAKEFEVPIVLLNTKEIAMAESKKIDFLQKEFMDNPESEILHTIIEEYHNNYAGLITLDKKSCKKYFNPKKAEKDLKKIVETISKLDDEKKQKELARDLKEYLQEEEEKRKLVNKKFIPFYFDKLFEQIDSIKFENVENQTSTSLEKEVHQKVGDKKNEISYTNLSANPKNKKNQTLKNAIDELNER